MVIGSDETDLANQVNPVNTASPRDITRANQGPSKFHSPVRADHREIMHSLHST